MAGPHDVSQETGKAIEVDSAGEKLVLRLDATLDPTIVSSTGSEDNVSSRTSSPGSEDASPQHYGTTESRANETQETSTVTHSESLESFQFRGMQWSVVASLYKH